MSKKVLLEYQNIVSGDMSGNLTSAVTNVQFMDNVSIVLLATGAPVGSFTVEVSADHNQIATGAVITAGTWVALDFGSSINISAADQVLISLNQLPFSWVRVKYTRTSGTGTLNGFIGAKEV